MAAGIFDVRGAGAAFQNLKRLATGLQAWPETIYTWSQFLSRKYGVNTSGVGSIVQVNRLRPFVSPTVSTLANYNIPQTRDAVSTDSANIQALAYDSVNVEVFERGMAGSENGDGPIAIKKQALALAQQDIMQHAQIGLKRNYSEYHNLMSREAIRTAISTHLYGNFRSTASAITDSVSDNLSVLMIKELKSRLVKLQVRPFGSYPNGDGQLLNGSYAGIYDVDGENELTSDAIWREFAKFTDAGQAQFAHGYSGELHGFAFYRTDSGASPTGAGPSGNINVGELIVMGQDPTLIEPPEGGGQGFVGEFPVVYAQVGPVEVVRAKEDNFERDWIVTWFSIAGWAQLEALDTNSTGGSQGDAATLTALLGGNTNPIHGVVAEGSSRYVHAAWYSRTTV